MNEKQKPKLLVIEKLKEGWQKLVELGIVTKEKYKKMTGEKYKEQKNENKSSKIQH